MGDTRTDNRPGELAPPRIFWGEGSPDCARREVELPLPLPQVGDDLDWQLRDYDSFRLFMLEELAARFPDRRRWTPADVEVVLAEVLAAVLDQISDRADRVASEAFLETARRPESVYRLLEFIDYDPAAALNLPENLSDKARRERTISLWQREPGKMELAREAGPRAIRDQHRMVTLADHESFLRQHPLVERARAVADFQGSWPVIKIGVIGWRHAGINDPINTVVTDPDLDPERTEVWLETRRFHSTRGLQPIPVPEATLYRLLRPYLDAYRMHGREVWLVEAVPVAIEMHLTIEVDRRYYRTATHRELDRTLGTGPSGFFQAGRLRFGEDLHTSDIYQQLTAVEGVKSVVIDRFRRLDSRRPDSTASGRIPLHGFEYAVCDNVGDPSRGYYRLRLNGGIVG